MEPFQEDEAVAHLLSIKSKVEKSIQDLNDEREKIIQRLNSIKELKAAERKKKTDEHLRMYRIKISLIDSNKRVEVNRSYVNQIMDTMNVIEGGILEQMKLNNFEAEISKLNSAIEGAISFYSEDSLQMELMKRSNAVRERRVEYTRLESEFNDLTRKIEDKRRADERAKKAELEKARLAEEYARRLEEERAQAEEARLRENYRQMALKPMEKPQSFLGDKIDANNESNGFLKPKSTNSSSINESEAASTGQTSEKDNSANKSKLFSEYSFSQLLRW